MSDMQLENDVELLKLMLESNDEADSIYQPGPYWKEKTVNAFAELNRVGLDDFRGLANGVLTSFGDNPFIDIRVALGGGFRARVLKYISSTYPFRLALNAQIRLTVDYFNQSMLYKTEFLKKNQRVMDLLSVYSMPNSTRGGCLVAGDINGAIISHHYLQLLDTIDIINRTINFKNKKSIFEIGGGFGANIHLIIELFPNIKKIIYLDIPPNLYVGTQYLKSFYGDAVIDYRKNKSLKSIKFSSNDSLEIFCITPAQIECLESEIDIFHNAHSFVEMPINIVKNYAKKIEKLIKKDGGVISLVSYDGYDDSTIDPNRLTGFFNRPFESFSSPTLTPNRYNFHYISK